MKSFTKENWQEVIDSPVPVLVDFWSPDCQPCKVSAVHMQAIGKEIESTNRSMRTASINIYEASDIGLQYRVLATPTFIVFKNGKEVDRHTGSGFTPLIDMAKRWWTP